MLCITTSVTKFFAAAVILATSVSIAGAQAATSPTKPISFGISAGAAVPTGDLSNGSSSGFSGVNTGYNVTGSLAFALPAIPFGIRADASYNQFGTRNVQYPIDVTYATSPGSNTANVVGNSYYNADVRVLGFTANLVFPLPLQATILRPYLIGGLGAYNVRTSPFGVGSSTQTNFGFNLGGGLTIPLSGFNTFIEARYHHANQDSGNISFVPITVGVMF